MGDFNYVTGILDRNGRKFESNEKVIAQQWENFQAEFNIEDTLRYQYPDLIRYSYSKGKSSSRIDRIYVPTEISGNLKKTTFTNTHLRDHKIVETTLYPELKKGPGCFSFENMLLKDKEYVKTMRDEIKELSGNRHTYNDKFELYEIFCQTVKYTTQEFIDKRHKEHYQKLNQVRQKIKKNRKAETSRDNRQRKRRHG